MIRSEEIDATIQNNLKERIAQIFAPNAVLDPATARIKAAGAQAWRETVKRYSAHFWGAGTAWVLGILSMPILAQSNEGLAVLGFLGMNAVAISLVIGGTNRAKRELTRYASPEVLRHAAKLVELSRAEQHYCAAVAALIDAGSTLGEPSQKELLRHLNELLARYRALEAPMQRYLSGGGGTPVEELERELGELTARRDAQDDPLARATMDQSLDLCARRLEHARRIEPAREQVAAQQELILQTMASVQASLARICAAGTVPVQTDVSELQESVSRVNRQARAVEEAIGEVITLGAL